MDRQLIFWTLALCLGVAFWLHSDVQRSQIYYDWHSYLIDNETGAKIEPRQLIELSKILKEPANYTNETSALDRLYDRTHNLNLAYGLAMNYIYSDKHQLEISAWPVSNETSCGQQLNWIKRQLNLHPNYKLLKGERARELSALIDSFGKLESGSLSGINTWVGSYSQCKKLTLNGGEMKMRYCVAKMRFKSWPEKERALPKSRINIGICLPETCDTASFARQRDLIEPLVKLELPLFYQENLNFEDLYCLPDERSPLRQIPTAGWMLIYFCALWTTLVIVATFVDLNLTKRPSAQSPLPLIVTSNGQKFASVMDKLAQHNALLTGGKEASNEDDRVWHQVSLVRVWNEFLADPFSDSVDLAHFEGTEIRLDMRCLNFYKVLISIGIVFGHCYFLGFMQSRSIEQQLEVNNLPLARLAFSLGRTVDAFFLFFGMLMAYNILKRVPASRLGNPMIWLTLNAYSLVRLWPLYLLTYLYARLIGPLTGDGPWWDYGTFKFSLRGQCLGNNWLQAIPHFGGWNTPALPSCVPPAWFIVSYVHIALLVPLITFLIYKLPNQVSRLLLLGYLFLIGSLELVLKMYKQTTLKPEAFTLYGGFLVTLLEKFESTGTMSTLGRIGCVALGCYMGYLLRQYELAKIKRWPGWISSKSNFIAANIVQLIVLLLPTIGFWLTKDKESTTEQFLAGYVLTMLLWILTLSVQMIFCFTVYNETPVIKFMSHRFWHTFNKLGFCIFLIHWEVLNFIHQHHEQAVPRGFKGEVLTLSASTLLVTIAISLVVHLLFEAPITRLLRAYFEPPKQQMVS